MTVVPRHALLVRLIGLAFFAFGTLMLRIPAIGEIAPGTFWHTLAVTTAVGVFFAASESISRSPASMLTSIPWAGL